MPLPSRYAPSGISRADENKSITVGKYIKKPVEYTIKTIETKVNNAVHHSKAQEDIEMVPMDDYGETELISEYIANTRLGDTVDYDSMEVDSSQDDAMLETGPNLSYLVIDTNFILSHLKVLNDIAALATKYQLRIIIPIVVMQELDGLKNSSRVADNIDVAASPSKISGKTIGHLARWANDWIYNQLADIHGPVKGQKVRQKIDRKAIKDDGILDCCIYFKENYLSNLVVLLSNDKNLCLKALSNEVLTVSYKENMTAAIIAETIYDESASQHGHLQMHHQAPVPQTSQVQHQPVLTHSQTFEEVAATIYNEVFVLTKSAIHHAMVAVYDTDLDMIQKYRPEAIMNLKDCEKTMLDFWISVFSDYLHSKARFVETVSTEVPSTTKALTEFVDFWGDVLHSIYQKALPEDQNKALSRLTSRWDVMLASLK